MRAKKPGSDFIHPDVFCYKSKSLGGKVEGKIQENHHGAANSRNIVTNAKYFRCKFYEELVLSYNLCLCLNYYPHVYLHRRFVLFVKLMYQ